MRILYIWIEKYSSLSYVDCNLAGDTEFIFNCESKTLTGTKKMYDSDNFFNRLDDKENQIPIELSAIVGKNGSGKTTILNNIFELLANKYLIDEEGYTNRNILIYESDGQKYITFNKGYIKQIAINDINIYNEGNFVKSKLDYMVNVTNSKENIAQLSCLSTCFFSNTYTNVCKGEIKNKFAYNLTNWHLLNEYIKNDDLFKNMDFKNNVFQPLDYWKFQELLYKNEFLNSDEFWDIREYLKIVFPANYNIVLDYASERINNILEYSKIMRFNDKTIDKFSFEIYMDKYYKKEFWDYLLQRICDILAERIFSIDFVGENNISNIIKICDKNIDINKFSSIDEILEKVLDNFMKIDESKFYINIFKNKQKEDILKTQGKLIYNNIKELVKATKEFINKIEPIFKEFDDAKLFEKVKEVSVLLSTKNNGVIGMGEAKLPLALYRKLQRDSYENEDLKKIIGLISELNKAQREYYRIVKNVPLIIDGSGLSSGEEIATDIFSKINRYKTILKENDKENKITDLVILFDEMDLCLHPEWKRMFIYLILRYCKHTFNKDEYKSIHIILSTNEPYVLSDIPKSNTVLINKNKEGKVKVINSNDYITLGANIIDLLNTSFFLEKGNKGEYITCLIKRISKHIKENSIEKLKKDLKIVSLIDEPIINKSLTQKIVNKLNETGKNDSQSKQDLIKYYEEMIENLKKGDE